MKRLSLADRTLMIENDSRDVGTDLAKVMKMRFPGSLFSRSELPLRLEFVRRDGWRDRRRV
jgi:hypothetical protein